MNCLINIRDNSQCNREDKMKSIIGKRYFTLNKSESYLIKKAREGNDKAFESLIMEYKTYLYKIAYTYVKDKDIALDIIQETTYKAWLNISTLNKDDGFKSWISKILVNTAINNIKKESKLVFIENRNNDIPYEASGISLEEKLDLYRAVDLLKPKYRMVIILRYFDDMKIEDISYVLDIPVNTVKSQLKRAIDQLNNILKEEYLNA